MNLQNKILNIPSIIEKIIDNINISKNKIDTKLILLINQMIY